MAIPHLQHKIHSATGFNNDPTGLPRRGFWSLGRKAQRLVNDIRQYREPGRKIHWWKIIKKTIPYLIVLFLLGAITLAGLFAWYSRDLPAPDKIAERAVAQSTKIYDRTGTHLLYDIHGQQNRTIIPLAEIPKYAINATIALEDQQFYQEKGFSIWGIFRGVVLRTLMGQSAQGGSTLTQQLVKNAILGDERSIVRKIKELILAYKIEQIYNKDQILQMYFNEIPYGSTAYGIEAASYNYFGKSAKDLTLAEAAILAALPVSPTTLSPYGSHVDRLFARQQYALDQMVKLKMITADDAAAAKKEKVVFKNKVDNITAPHFVFFVKELLAQKYGDQLIEQGGYKIISTLDWDLQQKAEVALKAQVEKNKTNFKAQNAAAVVIDVTTGQILAMVGSADYFNDEIDGQVNVATSPRQPGSSFKPIVYATAFSRGYVPETVLYDLVTTFPNPPLPDYIPHNYDSKEHGLVSLRQALAGSLNIPAVKMIYLAGINNVLDLADKLGYTTLKDRSRFGLSLVLGGGEVSLLEHANAYAAFARDGLAMPYSAVLSLDDNQGHNLYTYQAPVPEKVLEPDIARMLTDVLSDNNARSFIFGAVNYLTLPDRPVAAKTGTTNDYHDAWTIGYTPQIAVGVWVGNNDNTAMKKGADGSQIAAPIWQSIMKAALANLPVEQFIKPIYQIPNKPMLGGDASGITLTINKATGLLATSSTPADLLEQRTYKQVHDILQYVNKDDPLGPIPADPTTDPYYKFWEEPVQKWAAKNNIVNEQPPTTYDNFPPTTAPTNH